MGILNGMTNVTKYYFEALILVVQFKCKELMLDITLNMQRPCPTNGQRPLRTLKTLRVYSFLQINPQGVILLTFYKTDAFEKW